MDCWYWGNFDAVKIAKFHTWDSDELKSLTVLQDVKVGTSSEEQKHVRKDTQTQSEIGIDSTARKGKVYHHWKYKRSTQMIFTWDRETSSWCFPCYKRNQLFGKMKAWLQLTNIYFNSERTNVSRIELLIWIRGQAVLKTFFPLFFSLALAVNRSPAVFFLLVSQATFDDL